MDTPSLEPSVELRRRELEFRDERGGFSLTLKRNCSISPAGLACVFAALALAALAIGTGFALAGAWLVLPFAGLEALLLGAACAWCCAGRRKSWRWGGIWTPRRA